MLLTQTPYGKSTTRCPPGDRGIPGSQTGAQQLSGPAGLHRRGGGRTWHRGHRRATFGLFDPAQVTDGVTLVNWASRLPGFRTARSASTAPSYLAINQLLTAAAVGKNSPLKAIFPVVAGQRHLPGHRHHGRPDRPRVRRLLPGAYRRPQHRGPVCSTPWRTPPNLVVDAPQACPSCSISPTWAALTLPFTAQTLAGMASRAYDGAYWQARNPVQCAATDRRPTGSPPIWSAANTTSSSGASPSTTPGLQNAYAGPSESPQPMLPNQPPHWSLPTARRSVHPSERVHR